MFAKSTNITTPSIKTHARKGIKSILLVVIDLSLVVLLKIGLIYEKHETVQYIANVYCIEGVEGAGQSERERRVGESTDWPWKPVNAFIWNNVYQILDFIELVSCDSALKNHRWKEACVHNNVNTLQKPSTQSFRSSIICLQIWYSYSVCTVHYMIKLSSVSSNFSCKSISMPDANILLQYWNTIMVLMVEIVWIVKYRLWNKHENKCLWLVIVLEYWMKWNPFCSDQYEES